MSPPDPNDHGGFSPAPENASADSAERAGVSRRHFLRQLGATGLATMTPAMIAQPASASAAPPPTALAQVPVRLKVNGVTHALDVEGRGVLLDVIRDRLGLTGTKKGCDHGQCGACTVLIDGRRILSCLTLAATHDGASITTIEGLERRGELHVMQQAFLDHDAFQCGYCTSGQIMSAVGMLREPVGSDDAAVSEAMSGNLCRCGAYKNILGAVQAARGTA